MAGVSSQTGRVLVDRRLNISPIAEALRVHECIRIDPATRHEAAPYPQAFSVLIGESDSDLVWTRDLLESARRAAPGTALFLVSDQSAFTDAERRHFANAGADYVFCIGSADQRRHLAALLKRRARVTAPNRALRWMIDNPIGPVVDSLARWIIRNAYWRPAITSAARAFGVATRTVSRTLIRNSLPGYTVLRGLGMLLHAREMEARFGVSQSEAARRLRLADGSTLSRLNLRWSTADALGLEYCRALVALYPSLVRKWQDLSDDPTALPLRHPGDSGRDRQSMK